jgi:hypothetical protein
VRSETSFWGDKHVPGEGRAYTRIRVGADIAAGGGGVAACVRRRQRSTAALASTSWLRSTSGDGVGSEP